MNSSTTNPRAHLTFSTATLPGLIQAYVESGKIIFGFSPNLDALRKALGSPDTHELCVAYLQRGANALNVLASLQAGDIEHTTTLLQNLVREPYNQATALGRAKRDLAVEALPSALKPVEVVHE